MDRSDEEAEAGRRTPRGLRWRRLAVALLVLLAVVAATAWLGRRTIARGFVDRELARLGVPARYKIEQLSPWRQRLANVSIGDPRHPDLTADWIELRTAITPWRADVLVVKAGTVRMKGRIVDGALSLGTIDRLMPAPSGKPFVLPRLTVEVRDARMRLDTDNGRIDLALSGSGLLADGFVGALNAAAPQLAAADCSMAGMAATVQLRIRDGAPDITGPLKAARLTCPDARIEQPHIDVDAVIARSLDRWQGRARLATGLVETSFGQVRQAGGDIDFVGDQSRTAGKLALHASGLTTPQGAAADASVDGRYVIGKTQGFEGKVSVAGARVATALLDDLVRKAALARGTPVGPLAPRLAAAVRAAGRDVDGEAEVALAMQGDRTSLRLTRGQLTARSGARLTFDGGAGAGLTLPSFETTLDGRITLGGGGLPELAMALRRPAGSKALRGEGWMRPYAAGGASLGLFALEFRSNGGQGELTTVATLSGPVGTGRVDRLSMPLRLRWDGGALALNPGCETASFARVAVAGLTLDPARIALCPVGPAMLAWRADRLAGGIRSGRVALDGRIGDDPVRLAAGGARLDLGAGRFGISDAAVRLGTEGATRLDIARLDGRIDAAPAGSFEGLGGQIGAVPLVLSAGKGMWRFGDGALSLAGGFILTDAAASPRFEPLDAQQAMLRLRDDRIEASAALVGSKKPVAVGEVTLAHDLGTGTGHAVIDVPGVRFRVGGLQPNDLTALTYGVIADVDGEVRGTGRFDWSGEGVTSSGAFEASNVALAAAFGPVQGLNTRIDFADLLNLRSKSGQVATVAEINPGVPVRAGDVRYQLLDSQRVRVEGARWPFAGGELVLDPTTLDFSEAGERRLTFHVKGVDAALFLKEMAFDNLDASGTFDGVLPMIFDENGGRIEGGELRARAGGHIAYVGEVSQRDLGMWGNMAFQALKSLDYKNLAIRMNGPLAGEMITDIRFSGLSQGEGARSNFLIRRLAKLPFVFNVRISAPFRQLIDTVQSWYDPSRLVERNLPALIEAQKRAEEAGEVVQPRESAPVP
ncbi:intermembrane phospholipid transport protein YdbH family protein [Sphingomonas sp. RS6]